MMRNGEVFFVNRSDAPAFWKKVWDKREETPNSQERMKYLSKYSKTVPDHNKPKIPSTDDLRDYLNGSGNSAPGPDGIPFAILRTFSRRLAPILKEALIRLSKGIRPPPWFNSGKIIFLPKKGTL